MVATGSGSRDNSEFPTDTSKAIMEAVYAFDIDVETQYLSQDSQPEDHQFVFAYTITITNRGKKPATLRNRHWVITDANGEQLEVKGEGVVGEQPLLEPGESFQYTSGTVIKTPIGSMEGSYQMEGENGVTFDAEIPAFSLTQPGVLH